MRKTILTLLIFFSLDSFTQKIDYIEIDSKVFGEKRKVMVYTPRLYEDLPEKKYEVVYVFDSQARQYFDLVHSSLAFLNSAVPMIVVGIESPKRDDDFLPAYKMEETAKFMRENKGRADLFLKYVRDEVFAYVDDNYRTLPTRLAVGHSNGGVFVTYCLINDYEMFEAYIAISPHLRYDGMQMVEALNNFDPTQIQDKVFYYMCKGNESSEGWHESIMKAKTIFESDSYEENMQFEYNYFSNKTHTSVYPDAVLDGFESWFYFRYHDINNLKSYYVNLKDESEYFLSERHFLELAYDRFWSKDFYLTRSILEWGFESHPDSEMLKNLNTRLDVAEKEHTQDSVIFPEKCLGIWEGTMFIYKYDLLKDSVKVRFTVAKTESLGTYIWKTEYLSKKTPVVKDYKLIVDDLAEGRYKLDEGNGVSLYEYNVENKLYSLFKVQDIYLSASTELVGDQLIFEVTSGREYNQSDIVTNYSYTNVQRMVLSKIDD